VFILGVNEGVNIPPRGQISGTNLMRSQALFRWKFDFAKVAADPFFLDDRRFAKIGWKK
jgi:hypothetical protein